MVHEIASIYESFYLTFADMIDPNENSCVIYYTALVLHNLLSACGRRLKKRLLPNMICAACIHYTQTNMKEKRQFSRKPVVQKEDYRIISLNISPLVVKSNYAL